MDIEFDDTKDAANIAKHGVSLALGPAILKSRIGEMVDDRRHAPDHSGAQGQQAGATHMAIVKVTPRMVAKALVSA